MRVLVLSSVFPNVKQPALGVFVLERIRRLATSAEVVVVAPTPWFPFNRWVRRDRAAMPCIEQHSALTVYHPRFLSLPRYGKFLDGVLYFLCVLPFIARLRRKFPFDIIDAHFAYPDGLGATLLAKVFRCPVVVTLRGSIVRLAGYRLHRPQLRWALRHADRVVAVSEALARVASRLGLEPERIRVIPNGVDSTLFAPMDRTEARRLCGLPAGGPILLTVAAIYEGKGQHDVVESLPALTQAHPGLLYVMIGGPRPGENYLRRLEARVRALGLERHVRFAGARLHEELGPWFNAADVSVLATRSEGWPNVLLESLACGTPVVAADVGGVPEVVRDGSDGILFPATDRSALAAALRRALARTWDRTMLVHRARQCDWNETAELARDELDRALKAYS